jgi:hypothetical protein
MSLGGVESQVLIWSTFPSTQMYPPIFPRLLPFHRTGKGLTQLPRFCEWGVDEGRGVREHLFWNETQPWTELDTTTTNIYIAKVHILCAPLCYKMFCLLSRIFIPVHVVPMWLTLPQCLCTLDWFWLERGAGGG